MTTSLAEDRRRIDAKTGLQMRVELLETLQRILRRDTTECVAVLFLDLDRFKDMNSAYGPEATDELIKQVAARLRSLLGPGEYAFRPNKGDEFAVVMVNRPTQQEACNRSAEILAQLGVVGSYHAVLRAETKNGALAAYDPASPDYQRILTDATTPVTISASGGFSWWSRAQSKGDQDVVSRSIELLTQAGDALTLCKKQARQGADDGTLSVNILVYSAKEWAKHTKSEEAYRAFVRLVEQGAIAACYEPIYDLDGGIAGFEVFPDLRGHLAADVAVDAIFERLEGQTQAVLLWRQQIESACRQLRRWQDLGLGPVTLSINTQPRQLLRHHALSYALDCANAADVSTGQINLEITERQPLLGTPETITALERWRQAGFGLTIDDLLAGYASPLNILELRSLLTGVKLDAALIRSIADPDYQEEAEYQIKRCHRRSLQVTAEAVETADQLEILRQLGCDRAQGHFFGGKLTAEEATEALAAPSLW